MEKSYLGRQKVIKWYAKRGINHALMELIYKKTVLGEILRNTNCYGRLRSQYDREIVVSQLKTKFVDMVLPGKEIRREHILKIKAFWRKITKKQIAELEKEADELIDTIMLLDEEAEVLSRLA